jgi:hypothetical protein
MRRFFVPGVAAALVLGMLTSCGEPIPEETLLPVEDVLITGEGSQYLSVAAGEYTLKRTDGENLSITVKLEAIQTLDSDAFLAGKEDAEPDSKVGFDDISLLLTDSYGAAIDSYASLSPDYQGQAKLQDLLTGNYNEASVTFTGFVGDKKTMRKLMEAAGFELAQADITYEKKKASASGGAFGGLKDAASDALSGLKGLFSGSDSSVDVDELLDSFEEYTTAYITGDINEDYREDVEEYLRQLYSQLAAVSDDFSPRQAARFEQSAAQLLGVLPQ